MNLYYRLKAMFDPPSADELMLRQREDLRRELLTYQRALEQITGEVSGLKQSIARLDNDIKASK